ncbi:MAG: hypothetical protein WD250_15135 [Egibacteraceae bacterium]
MGSDSAKTHEAFTVAPAEPARLSDAVDVRDDRPAGSTPLHLDANALDTALAAVGVTVGPHTLVKVRLRPQQFPGQQGSAQRIGPDAYRVVIHVVDKPTFKDRHLYVVNNSLLHELRHVAQMQHDPDHELHYANENLTVGYAENKYEVEARYYGRLADHIGEKNTGPAGPALGKSAWAVRTP